MEGAAKKDSWLEADALFTAALEMDATAREEFLTRECADRPDLRREVEELLDAVSDSESCFTEIPGVIGTTLDECISDRVDARPDRETANAGEPTGSRIGRYRIVRQLARGGMGTVYLAERADGAFQRRVALKLLRRGLDTDDILERFRAERQILADLEHPNIARLIDGGSTDDGRPYLAMEYVEGVPITDFCADQELDLRPRLRLFVEVCEAVQHAHDHGVIHRDLKPGNILVDRTGHAKLLDFGIARLLDSDARAARTRPGLRLLTPDYASPEQVCGGEVDVTSDVYQLGLLLYELLSGALPYRVEHRSVAELERVICREPVVPPSSRASDSLSRRLRGDLDHITLKALRKNTVQRYGAVDALAADVRRHLQGRPVAARSGARGYRLRSLARRHRVELGLAAAAGFALLVTGLMTGRGAPPAAAPGGESVAVLPFRVSGADMSLEYLREGMVDLLSTKLTGEGGPRAVAPATVLDAWRDAGGSRFRDVAESRALGLAGEIGAGQLLVGEVVGTPDRMILNASLLRVPGGEVAARATVQGPADSLLSIVDRLTARLLVLGADERYRPLDTLATSSLPALREYLEGRVAFRAASYEDAYERFGRAVELDSTFALAAIWAWQAAWSSQRTGARGLLDIAWRGRDRLDDLDRAIVTALLGRNYPAPTSDIERLADNRRLVDMSPDRGEFRYMYADRMYHWHAILGLPDGEQRAAAQLRRALAADSAYGPTYEHLVPLLYALGESEEAGRIVRAYFRRDPASAEASFLAWCLAVAEADPAALERLRGRFGELADRQLIQIFSTAVHQGIEVGDAERALTILGNRGLTPALRQRVLRETLVLHLLRGRPAAAVEAAEVLKRSQAEAEGFPRLEATNALVLSALYGDGDHPAAERAVQSLERSNFGPNDAPQPGARLVDLCTVAQWRLWSGEPRGVRATIERLRRADTRTSLKDTGPVCAMLLEAVDATLRSRADAPERVARLDSALASGPHVRFTLLEVEANIAAAWLYERLGDPERALAAIRRRVHSLDSTGLLLATSLRVEGRLATAVGDTTGAIRAYRHYLALRSDPEPVLQPQADSVRAALAELTAASAQR